MTQTNCTTCSSHQLRYKKLKDHSGALHSTSSIYTKKQQKETYGFRPFFSSSIYRTGKVSLLEPLFMKFPIHVCTAENFHHYLNYNFVNNVMCFYMKN